MKNVMASLIHYHAILVINMPGGFPGSLWLSEIMDYQIDSSQYFIARHHVFVDEPTDETCFGKHYWLFV